MKKIITFFVTFVLVSCTTTTYTPYTSYTPTATVTTAMMPRVTSVPTHTPIPTSTATLTLTPTSTVMATPTLELTATPVFPSSMESFREEVGQNCFLPEEEFLEIENSYFSYLPDFMKGISKEYLSDEIISDLKREALIDSLAKNIEENWVKFNVTAGIVGDVGTWYCVGIVVTTSNNSGIIELLEESNWGNWNFPLVLAYWSKDGLVVYEYEPTNMPVP
jgi:hypothetical protein